MKTLAELKTAIETKITAVNSAIDAKDNNKIIAAMAELDAAEKEYAKQKTAEVFDECKNAANPWLKAAEVHFYDVIGHDENKKDGVLLNVSIVDDKRVQIDLQDLGEHCHISKNDWYYDVTKLYRMVCFFTAKRLDKQEDGEAKIWNSLDQKWVTTNEDVSNRAVVRSLQTVLDKMIMVPVKDDNGNEKNKYEAGRADVNALSIWAATRDKKTEHGTRMCGLKKFFDFLGDVLNAKVTDDTYTVSDNTKEKKGEKQNEDAVVVVEHDDAPTEKTETKKGGKKKPDPEKKPEPAKQPETKNEPESK